MQRRNGEILFHSHLPAENARIALDVIRRHGLATVILGNALREDVIWIDGAWHDNERIASYVNRNRHAVREFAPEALEFDPIQFIVMDTQEKLEALDEALTGHAAPLPSEDPPAQTGVRRDRVRARLAARVQSLDVEQRPQRRVGRARHIAAGQRTDQHPCDAEGPHGARE